MAAWQLYDTRTKKTVGISSYPTAEAAYAAIRRFRARDARGGRPDLRDLMPHLDAREAL